MRGRRALACLALTACSRGEPRSAPSDGPAPVAVASTAGPVALPHEPRVEPPRVEQGVYMGRTIAAPMSYRGADWLDRPDRDATQQPEHVLDVLGVKAGQTVGDVGCGSGYFTMHLARRVGPRGRVYATDLQPEMLAMVEKRTRDAQLTNVTLAVATADDAHLPERAIDLLLLVDVYHELPNPPASLAQFARALRSSGRLALVEYRAEDPKVAIKPEHKTTLAQLKRELGESGFAFVASDESLPEQRIVTFAPPARE